MNRLLIVVLFLGWFSLAQAGNGHGVPLCPTSSSPDCVTTNWGQTVPDSTDSAVHGPAAMASVPSSPRPGIHMAVAVPPTTGSADASTTSIRSIVSPVGLFVRETKALTAALKKARFNDDGTFATGKPAVARAAADLVRKAGTKYMLTLYIRTTPAIRPDDSDLLDKRVLAVNDVLENPAALDPGKPNT